ncbi:MAG: PAS domain-containing protein, partial [Pseudomonadota bacterium]
MDASSSVGSAFKNSLDSFGDLSGPSVAAIVLAASDVALIISDDGVVQDLAVNEPDLPRNLFDTWVGRPFADQVTVESRPKVERLLTVASEDTATVVQAHINHPRSGGEDLPVRYATTPLSAGRILAVGTDLTPIATAQRRLLAAQRAADREYAKLRGAEARFREYFQLSREPAVFLDDGDRIS